MQPPSSISSESQTSFPLPKPTKVSQPHWEACNNKKLLVQHCNQCNQYTFPPQAFCSVCFTDNLAWVESTGQGEIYSFTEVHRAQQPAFETPYVAAIIEMSEGWFMLSNINDHQQQAVTIGQAVQVEFCEIDGFHLPLFNRS